MDRIFNSLRGTQSQFQSNNEKLADTSRQLTEATIAANAHLEDFIRKQAKTFKDVVDRLNARGAATAVLRNVKKELTLENGEIPEYADYRMALLFPTDYRLRVHVAVTTDMMRVRSSASGGRQPAAPGATAGATEG